MSAGTAPKVHFVRKKIVHSSEKAAKKNMSDKRSNTRSGTRRRSRRRRNRRKQDDSRVKVVVRALPVKCTSSDFKEALKRYSDAYESVDILYYNQGEERTYGNDIASTAFICFKDAADAIRFVTRCQREHFVCSEKEPPAIVEIAPFGRIAKLDEATSNSLEVFESSEDYVSFLKSLSDDTEESKSTSESDTKARLSEEHPTRDASSSLVKFLMRKGANQGDRKKNKTKKKKKKDKGRKNAAHSNSLNDEASQTSGKRRHTRGSNKTSKTREARGHRSGKESRRQKRGKKKEGSGGRAPVVKILTRRPPTSKNAQ